MSISNAGCSSARVELRAYAEYVRSTPTEVFVYAEKMLARLRFGFGSLDLNFTPDGVSAYAECIYSDSDNAHILR